MASTIASLATCNMGMAHTDLHVQGDNGSRQKDLEPEWSQIVTKSDSLTFKSTEQYFYMITSPYNEWVQ